MLRKLKPTTRDTAPTILVSVGAVSSAAPWQAVGGGTPHVLDRCCVVVRRRTKAGWGKPREIDCPGWADVWDALDALAASGRRVYVVAGRASDLLTQLHWWDRVQDGTYTVWDRSKPAGKVGDNRRRHPLVIQGRPDVIGYTYRDTNYRWVSVTNWCDISIADAARQVGYPIPADADAGDKWEACRWAAVDQARVISLYMVRLIDWWLKNKCGSWQDTPGAAAWSSFLRRVKPSAIDPHDDPNAKQLENQACFGGRASCWFYGDVGDPDVWGELADAPPPSRKGFGLPGPLHRIDVGSMYPTLLRDRRYPVRLLAVDCRPTLSKFRDRVRYQLAVARVVVRPTESVYPRRVKGKVQYPLGSFTTTLTTPELLRADARGEIEDIIRVAWYTPGEPFRAWATWGLGCRSEMKAGTDKVGEAVVKLLTNSLSGRLARRKIGWRDRPHAVPVEWWGQWPETDGETGETVMWRGLAGHVQELVRDDERPATQAACYAHLTAYGRCLMNDVREVAGRRQVIWQDTDGLLVTDTGLSRVKRSEHFAEGVYGKLRFERTHHHGRILTPKHYWFDGAWTLSGVHDGFYITDGTHAHSTLTANPVRSASEPTASAVFRAVRHIDLTRIEPGVTVDADGWASPPVLRMGATLPAPPTGQQLLPEGE